MCLLSRESVLFCWRSLPLAAACVRALKLRTGQRFNFFPRICTVQLIPLIGKEQPPHDTGIGKGEALVSGVDTADGAEVVETHPRTQ